MEENYLTVREITINDIKLITDYWFSASDQHLTEIGVYLAKIPQRQDFTQLLKKQISLPYEKKKSYALIWLLDKKPVGHCNLTNITFGKEATMHLHMWHTRYRYKGIGYELLRISLPLFFANLNLEQIVCEPYALNPAPNKTLAKLGFKFDKEYTTIPGSINFEQDVKRWVLPKRLFSRLDPEIYDCGCGN